MKKKNTSFLLYEAWKDALTIEPEEILPVITITKDNPHVLWNHDNKVLMLSFHRHPELYQDEKDIILDHGEIWVTSFLEMKHWYQKNDKSKNDVKNWANRFEQLLGVDLSGKETHFTGFWISPEDLIRPAYNPDVASDEVWDHFPSEFQDIEYQKWFEEHCKKAYEQKKLPWTRLGYTYDWEDNGTEFGLCEFLVKKNASARICFTKTISDFVTLLEQNQFELDP